MMDRSLAKEVGIAPGLRCVGVMTAGDFFAPESMLGKRRGRRPRVLSYGSYRIRSFLCAFPREREPCEPPSTSVPHSAQSPVSFTGLCQLDILNLVRRNRATFVLMPRIPSAYSRTVAG